MKNIHDLCSISDPNPKNNAQQFRTPSYIELIDSFEFETLLSHDRGSYQGDSWYLLRDGKRYGYLVFGWGSCSGCDALEGCSSLEELEALQKDLYDNIVWKDSPQDMLTFLKEHDWKGDFDYSPRFVEYATLIMDACVLIEQIPQVLQALPPEESRF